MADQRSFGRRINAQPRRERAPAAASVVAPETKTDFLSLDPGLPHDDDLEEWKRSRRFQIPWRQLSLMASLCFGIASFALPDSVNDNVQWLLYGLMAVSLYAGLSKRFRKAVE